MAVVVDGKIVVDGMVVGSVEDTQYTITDMVDVRYDRQTVYIIGEE